MEESNADFSFLLRVLNIDERSLNAALNDPDNATERAYRLTEAGIVLSHLMRANLKKVSFETDNELALILFEDFLISEVSRHHGGLPPADLVKDRVENLLSRYRDYAASQYGGIDEWEKRHLTDAKRYIDGNVVGLAQASFQVATLPELGRL